VQDTVKVAVVVPVLQRTDPVAGAVPVKELGGRYSIQVVEMVQPESPHVGPVDTVTGVGGGVVTAAAPVTVKPLKTKFAEEQEAEEEHAGESSQDILPLHTLQTGTRPVLKAEVIP
jgi:hypothetical protein